MHMIVERFSNRSLDWQTAEQARALVAYEIKLAALRQPRGT
jgi:hypothetical protein